MTGNAHSAIPAASLATTEDGKAEREKKKKKKTQPTLCKALLQRVLRSRPVSDLSLPLTVCGENIQQVASSGRAHSQQFLSQEGLGSLSLFLSLYMLFWQKHSAVSCSNNTSYGIGIDLLPCHSFLFQLQLAHQKKKRVWRGVIQAIMPVSCWQGMHGLKSSQTTQGNNRYQPNKCCGPGECFSQIINTPNFWQYLPSPPPPLTVKYWYGYDKRTIVRWK